MSNATFGFSTENWHIISENKEYYTPIFNILKRRARPSSRLDASAGDFYIIDAPDWINVIALTREKEIVVVEQYRHGTQTPSLELPAGMVDRGEEPLDTAKRELLEETGYRSESWSKLGEVSSNPAIMNNYTHIYLAEGCHYTGGGKRDMHEQIKVHRMPLQRFLDLAGEGVVDHAIVLASLARYLLGQR